MIRIWLLCAALSIVVCGCTTGPGSAPPGYGPAAAGIPPIRPNPLFVPAMDKDVLYEQVVDVVDDYFRIAHEERPHQLGDIITEGRIETHPETASTIFEPWRGDSATAYERWESTLQSTRRKASLRIAPAQGGYMIEVAVLKELEDIKHPARYFASDHRLDTDQYPDRYVDPATKKKEGPTNWFPLRRDAPLEQEILARIQQRVGAGGGGLPMPPAVPASPATPVAPIIIPTPPPLPTLPGIFPPPNELPPPPVR